MSKDLKKVYSITMIQVVIYVIAFAMAFLNRGSHRTGPSTCPSRNIRRIFYPPKISLTIFFDCSGYFFKEPYATYRKYNRTDRHLFRHFSGNLFKSCLEGV